MSDELPPYSSWLVSVAAEAKRRPWMVEKEDPKDTSSTIMECVSCGCDAKHFKHYNDCIFLALDAALDKEPT